MSILIDGITTAVTCNAAGCRARHEVKAFPPVPELARGEAIMAGWVSVTPPSQEPVDYCQRHALGSKRAGSPAVRVFQPPLRS